MNDLQAPYTPPELMLNILIKPKSQAGTLLKFLFPPTQHEDYAPEGQTPALFWARTTNADMLKAWKLIREKAFPIENDEIEIAQLVEGGEFTTNIDALRYSRIVDEFPAKGISNWELRVSDQALITVPAGILARWNPTPAANSEPVEPAQLPPDETN